MTGGVTADIVLPIVIAVALTTWLLLLFYANAHPSRGQHAINLPTEVRGGEFQAVEGGRQLMPIPEHRPAVPGQRQSAATETYQVPARSTAGATATATGPAAGPVSEDDVETRPMAGHRPA